MDLTKLSILMRSLDICCLFIYSTNIDQVGLLKICVQVFICFFSLKKFPFKKTSAYSYYHFVCVYAIGDFRTCQRFWTQVSLTF